MAFSYFAHLKAKKLVKPPPATPASSLAWRAGPTGHKARNKELHHVDEKIEA